MRKRQGDSCGESQVPSSSFGGECRTCREFGHRSNKRPKEKNHQAHGTTGAVRTKNGGGRGGGEHANVAISGYCQAAEIVLSQMSRAKI
jgi:hypothetical protein